MDEGKGGEGGYYDQKKEVESRGRRHGEMQRGGDRPRFFMEGRQGRKKASRKTAGRGQVGSERDWYGERWRVWRKREGCGVGVSLAHFEAKPGQAKPSQAKPSQAKLITSQAIDVVGEGEADVVRRLEKDGRVRKRAASGWLD